MDMHVNLIRVSSVIEEWGYPLVIYMRLLMEVLICAILPNQNRLKVLSEWFTFDNDFLVDEGRDDPNTTISGPLWARQQNAI